MRTSTACARLAAMHQRRGSPAWAEAAPIPPAPVRMRQYIVRHGRGSYQSTRERIARSLSLADSPVSKQRAVCSVEGARIGVELVKHLLCKLDLFPETLLPGFGKVLPDCERPAHNGNCPRGSLDDSRNIFEHATSFVTPDVNFARACSADRRASRFLCQICRTGARIELYPCGRPRMRRISVVRFQYMPGSDTSPPSNSCQIVSKHNLPKKTIYAGLTNREIAMKSKTGPGRIRTFDQGIMSPLH